MTFMLQATGQIPSHNLQELNHMPSKVLSSSESQHSKRCRIHSSVLHCLLFLHHILASLLPLTTASGERHLWTGNFGPRASSGLVCQELNSLGTWKTEGPKCPPSFLNNSLTGVRGEKKEIHLRKPDGGKRDPPEATSWMGDQGQMGTMTSPRIPA